MRSEGGRNTGEWRVEGSDKGNEEGDERQMRCQSVREIGLSDTKGRGRGGGYVKKGNWKR